MKFRRTAIAALGLTALSLSACHNGGGDEAPAETNLTNVEAPVNEAPVENVATPSATPTAPAGNATTATKSPSADFADEQQAEDFADATGRTDRVARGDEPGNTDAGEPAQ